MKNSRILLILLFALSFAAPRLVRAAGATDTLRFSPDCGSSAAWDFTFLNEDPQFITSIVLIISPADTSSFSFSGSGNTFYPVDTIDHGTNIWGTDTVSANGDMAVWIADQGRGLITGQKDGNFYFQLGGPGGTSLPPNLFDSTVHIKWEAFSGPTLVDQGFFIPFTPTIYQGNCTFDFATVTSKTVGCDPQFDFHVFNKNGLQYAIDELKFVLQDPTAGAMRPSEIIPPPGWKLDSVTQFSASFHSAGGNIGYNSNLDGFLVALRANPAVNRFSFVMWAYSGGGLIDRDTIDTVAASPQSCSFQPTSDSVSFTNAGACTFRAVLDNYHTGDNNLAVSPITEWKFVIKTPGATWSDIQMPREPIFGTWEFYMSGDTLSIDLVPKFRYNSALAQPGGIVWSTMKVSIDNPNPGSPLNIAWSDSSFTTAVSSGTSSISCKIGNQDTAFVTSGTNCDYTLTFSNKHTVPESSVNSIALRMPSSAGKFLTGCVSDNNGWDSSTQAESMRFFNQKGAPGFLTFGNSATFHFCIFPAIADSSWPLTVYAFDSTGGGIDTLLVTVPGCTPPPPMLDSIYHGIDKNSCFDTLLITSNRSVGITIDSVLIQAFNGWQVSVEPKIGWTHDSLSPSAIVLIGTIDPETENGFSVTYTPTKGAQSPFPVEVVTFGHDGIVNINRDTILCQPSGVISPAQSIKPLSISIVPNPMNSEASITLTTASYDRVQITLLDVLGHIVKVVGNGTMSAGDHNYSLDVSQIPDGAYYLRAETSNQTMTKKLVVQH